MAEVKTRRFDPANYITSIEDVVATLDVAFESGDPADIAEALGDIARSEGMAEIAKKTGLSRESLYKSLSAEGNPSLDTLVRVLRALGLRLTVAADEIV